MREAQKQLEERLESARDGVQTRVEGVKDAVEAGRKAAVEARDELERKLERSKAAYRAGVDAARQVVAAGDEDDGRGGRRPEGCPAPGRSAGRLGRRGGGCFPSAAFPRSRGDGPRAGR